MKALAGGLVILGVKLAALVLIVSIIMGAVFAAGFTFGDSRTVWPYLGLLAIVIGAIVAIGFCVDCIEDFVRRRLPRAGKGSGSAVRPE